ncbi:type I-F CRISPR-associated protein Csy2 [Chitinimonas lacunae]|uniref:Type I-F CRISPR-associated protein Csy2 n=1 Tax=Chitinimonas lacunae TaxID=1963018 RepID=A0ABV8MN52_9NEIS
MFKRPDALLRLPHLYVQNANAISSPLTWGFPAPSAFTGFVHALSRQTEKELGIRLDGTGIVSHGFSPQASSPPGKRTQVFHLTRNPIKKNGNTASIVEEGRIHLDLSLLIGVYSAEPLFEDEDELQTLAHQISQRANAMRLAGGSLLPHPHRRPDPPELHFWPHNADEARQKSRQIRRRLLPGFALVERQDKLERHLTDLKTDSVLEALLDLSRLNYEPPTDIKEGEPARWTVRSKPGWLVPLPLGYGAISPLYPPGEVENSRDPETPFRFVETLLGLGEWISPHRIDDMEKLLWYHDADPENGLYRCRNDFAASPSTAQTTMNKD